MVWNIDFLAYMTLTQLCDLIHKVINIHEAISKSFFVTQSDKKVLT